MSVKMEADFSGYVTKAGLVCTDGLTIMPGAFKHQDEVTVPLVWQHGHTDPENVLGHVLLEDREDGVYGYGFFNKSQKAAHARELLDHKDINAMSIWANDLMKRSKKVLHGAIREVSLVLAGANPGALIDSVAVRHGDDTEILDDEAIIYTGLGFEDSDKNNNGGDNTITHAADDEETIEDIFNTLSEKQKTVVYYMIGEAVDSSGTVEQSNLNDNATTQEVFDSLNEKQTEVVHFMLSEALKAVNTDNDDNTKGTSMGEAVKHNVFESGDKNGKQQIVLSHDAIQGIVADASKMGSLKAAVEAYAENNLQHGIQDIDVLFPDAKTIDSVPELYARRVEWVNKLMGAIRKSPFTRIKTLSADLTVAEARAKGYVTGSLKKEEFFRVKGRVTTPTTIYKKQKLDRDDILDITDFDVVAWLKGEMRIMLDEEVARAVLVGDGRAADDEDKIDEERIRPVATDHELYTTVVNVNIDDSNSNFSEVVDAIAMNRSKLRGSGLPTMFTTEHYIARAMTQRDSLGRRLYKSLDELATESRVSAIVPVEVLEEYDDIVAILFNPADYVLGADKGGSVSMFDDFDIDYNQYKYLIETRLSGALNKLKSAMVVKKVAGSAALVVPAEPAFDGTAVTITNQTGVVYRNADTDAVINAVGSPYPVAEGTTMNVSATPASGYYFSDSDVDDWSFTNEA